MVVAKEAETRKGPWTEQEDLQLVCFVRLFGERRWDFIAKVSGLKRTGKSCRLRWVNYLHPGLKRGRMTPQEERLVLELHSRWGNRFDPLDHIFLNSSISNIDLLTNWWSRIARKLPGRTDNEIKNYWRTHMRKKAQERKRNSSPSFSSTTSSSNSLSPSPSELPKQGGMEIHEHDSSIGEGSSSVPGGFEDIGEGVKGYSMDQIWKEIATSETVSGLSFEECKDEACNISCPPLHSPLWEYCSDTLWKIDDEELKMFPPMCDHLFSNYQHGRES